MKNYTKTTFSEYSKNNDTIGKTFVYCKKCGVVLDDREIPLKNILDCPRCQTVLEK